MVAIMHIAEYSPDGRYRITWEENTDGAYKGKRKYWLEVESSVGLYRLAAGPFYQWPAVYRRFARAGLHAYSCAGKGRASMRCELCGQEMDPDLVVWLEPPIRICSDCQDEIDCWDETDRVAPPAEEGGRDEHNG